MFVSIQVNILKLSISCKKDNTSDIVPNPVEISLEEAENIQIFPANHPLNRDISNDPIDPNSDRILQNIGLTTGLFPDFGSGTWEGAPIGIPYVVVGADQELIQINYTAYGDESDAGPFPMPLNSPIEGNGNGDSHVISVDIESGMLYEIYLAEVNNGAWDAASGAKYNLNTVEFRPAGWTSADAAGLPIFPCLVRYTEIEKSEIDHAIRFTLSRNEIYQGYVHPARHLISGGNDLNLLPMGGRLRLKADFDISSFSETNQIILRALKKHGLILADAGSSMYISGAPNDNWNNDDLKDLKNVTVSDFEVIELGDIQEK